MANNQTNFDIKWIDGKVRFYLLIFDWIIKFNKIWIGKICVNFVQKIKQTNRMRKCFFKYDKFRQKYMRG